MKTQSIIEALSILQKYLHNKDGCDVSFARGAIYVERTDFPIGGGYLIRLIELGWVQDSTNYLDDEETNRCFAVKHYNPEYGWVCYS